jgi:hypothetical protein
MKWLKLGAVIFGAVVITALGIDAADTLSGSRSTLLGQVIGSVPTSVCGDGMVEVPVGGTFSCVDIYEASASPECPNLNPSNELQTQENMNESSCKAVSNENVDAWRFVSREQAFTACMRAGKRLPLASEWYTVSVGTPDDSKKCNIDSNGPTKTGDSPECVSAAGVHDAIGNVWEWTSDDVVEGKYNGRDLPESGHVNQVDSSGVAVMSSSQPSDIFYKDYFWSSRTGFFGMLRGGYYGSREDAGVYSIHADTVPTTAGTAIGFRCVK